ncbi:MAG: polysaccharide biosynthesis/export family protein [Candidatus Eremiobacteraeota bacterium]|nr:polysaccharide biosynthesis/export family protein [Candidatus Eremiobacteraeota bacterium]
MTMLLTKHLALSRMTVPIVLLASAAMVLGISILPASAATRPNTSYIIHPHDILNVQVFGDPSLSQSETVLAGGDISYPLVGKIHVGGQTPDQAARTIASSLKKYVRNPIVNVSVATQGQLNVMVLGDVKTPGKFALDPQSHLTDAIAAAGGIGPTNGALPDARVGAVGDSAQSVPLEQLLRGGNSSLDIPLKDQTVVYIPSPTTFNIEVAGAVDHPGELQMNEGDRLSMVIAKAGDSSTTNGDLNNIHITRLGPDGKTSQYTINLYQELQQGDVSKDITMQKGDVVYVPEAHQGLTSSKNGSFLTPIVLLLSRLIPHL